MVTLTNINSLQAAKTTAVAACPAGMDQPMLGANSPVLAERCMP